MIKRYIVRDKYFQMAKEQNLRTRSAFKLDNIQKKFHLIQKGQTVADLGAAPGSWAQRLSQWVGADGRVIAIDIQKIEPIANNVEIHCSDITDHELLNKIFDQKLDGILADLAPKTTGIHDADTYHSAELNGAVLDVCEKQLKAGGYLVTKIFQGEEFADIVRRAKTMFKQVKCFKPEASRDRSRETYIIGIGFKGR
jgi:23S rRNA (uridine2552-2'-O)-methyltransferase